MVFFVAFVSAVATAYIVVVLRAPPGPQYGTFERIACKALLPFSAAMLGASLVFTWLSFRLAVGTLDDRTIGQLHELERDIPAWAVALGNAVPPWIPLVLAVLGFLLAWIAARKEQRRMAVAGAALKAVKRGATALQWIVAFLGAASVFTMFGDGMQDQARRVQQQIHEARLRLQSTQDLIVAELGKAVAEQTIAAVMAQPDEEAAAFARAHSSYDEQMKDLHGFASLGDETRWLSPEDLVRAHQPVRWPGGMPARDRAMPAAPEAPWRWSPAADAFPREHMASGAAGRFDQTIESRQEVAKEFIAAGMAALKEAAAADPTTGFLFEVVAAAVSEVLSDAARRHVLEPVLMQVWKSAHSGKQHAEAAIREHARRLSGDINTGKYWNRHHDRDKTRAVTAELDDRLRVLARRGVPEARSPLGPTGRGRLVDLLQAHGLRDAAAVLLLAYEEADKDPADRNAAADAKGVEIAARAALLTAVGGNGSLADRSFRYDVQRSIHNERLVDRVLTPHERWMKNYARHRTPGGGVSPPRRVVRGR